MPAEQGTEGIEAKPSQQGRWERVPLQLRWRKRKSVRVVRREASEDHDAQARDQRHNDRTRLPDAEQVRLAGLILIEAFTPSRISALRKALEDFAESSEKKVEWIAQVEKNRSQVEKNRSAAGGRDSQNLGSRRASDQQLSNGERADPTLPKGVTGVGLYMYFPVPTLTMIVATFTLADQAGDLSHLLRTDYHTETIGVRVQVPGRFGRIRAHIPWARPANLHVSPLPRRADKQKQLACESFITDYEDACWSWMSANFPGRFSAERLPRGPAVRLLLIKESDHPFEVPGLWRMPVGLAFNKDIWRSAKGKDWFLRFSAQLGDRRFTATAAARRPDAFQSPGPDGSDHSAQDRAIAFTSDRSRLTVNRSASDQSRLMVTWAMTCLLSGYADRLAGLRDRSGKPRRVSRPVRQARELDRYLIGDGLDAAAIVSDLESFTKDEKKFLAGVAEYTEYLNGYSEQEPQNRQPRELAPWLEERIQNQVTHLARDTAATITNVSASASLRQAVQNTQLQRVILCVSVLAIVIAIISLVNATH